MTRDDELVQCPTDGLAPTLILPSLPPVPTIPVTQRRLPGRRPAGANNTAPMLQPPVEVSHTRTHARYFKSGWGLHGG